MSRWIQIKLIKKFPPNAFNRESNSSEKLSKQSPNNVDSQRERKKNFKNNKIAIKLFRLVFRHPIMKYQFQILFAVKIKAFSNRPRLNDFFPHFLFFFFPSGSVRIPLQMSKCNHGTNSAYLSMNSFNNNNLTVPGATDETAITTSDNLLLQATPPPPIASQHWTRNLNGNSQRSSSASWRVNRSSLSLNLSENNSKATNHNATDDLTPVNTNNGQKLLHSPFDYPAARYRKTWI